MKMIPPYLSTSTRSNAERKVYEALERTSLPGEWFALHSLELARHPTKPYGEIDFLVVGSLGVFVLEVKGGTIAYRDGVWTYTDRFGEPHRHSEGPFNQARTATHALKAYLERTMVRSVMQQVVVGYGVVLPDVLFTATGIEFDPAIVLDSRDFGGGMEGYIGRLNRYWRGKFPARPANIERDVVKGIVDRLRPDFELVRSIRATTTDVEQRQIALTDQQYVALEYSRSNPHILVRGGAGTGKTLLAVELARREAGAGRSVLLVCHNPMLARFIADQLTACTGVTVRTVTQLLVTAVRRLHTLPDGYEAGLSVDAPWFEETLLPAANAVLRALPDAEKYDTLIVDEAQDVFGFAWFDAFGAFLRGGLEQGRWRVFHDRFNQGGVRGLADAEEVEAFLSTGATVLDLDTNCRNTSAIVSQTRLATGADLGKTSDIAGVPVATAPAGSPDEAAAALARHLDQLIRDEVDPRTITILSPRAWEASAASRLPERLRRKIVQLSANGHLTHPANGMAFSTIADFKGLENSHVAIVDIEAIDNDPRTLSELYVAMTRPRVSLWLAVTPAAAARLTELKIARWEMVAKGLAGG